MRLTKILVPLALALTVSACTSIRVSGFVTDATTNVAVSSCGITFGHFYTHVDPAGHYVIKGRKSWAAMQVTAPGYEPQSVPVDSSKTRYPVVNIQLRSLKGSKPQSKDAPE